MATTVDETKLQDFVGRFAGDFGAALHQTTVIIGDELGLYRAMADGAPLTAAELAERTRHRRALRPRVALRAGRQRLRRVRPRPGASRCRPSTRLPCSPTRARLPAAGVLPVRARCRRRAGARRAVPHRRRRRLARARPRPLARHRARVRGRLPRAPGRRLAAGARRRRGEARGGRVGGRRRLRPRRLDDPARAGLPELAVRRHRLPRASIEPARRRGGRRRRPRHLRGRRRQRLRGDGFDLVCVFDAFHDLGDPVGAAAHVRQALAPDGTWLLVEPFAGDPVEDNLNPIGRVLYSASTMLCTPARARRRSDWPSAPRPARRACARW